jgi:hypothetical protein
MIIFLKEFLMLTEDDIINVSKYFKENIKSIKQLEKDYFYNHLPLCVINAVWSISVKYEGVLNVVKKYCKRRKLDPYRSKELQENSQYPDINEQESILVFINYMKQYSFEELADNIFENHQRTSTKSGILKAEAVFRFAEVLSNYNINYFQDITNEIENNELLKLAIKEIRGQKSGISLDYFFMLSGNENRIKPDRMIKRFLAKPLGIDPDTISSTDAQIAFQNLYVLLDDKRITSVRHLDNIVWNYQRNIK